VEGKQKRKKEKCPLDGLAILQLGDEFASFFLERQPEMAVKTMLKKIADKYCIDIFFVYVRFSVSFLL
jgi:hypothetical protein